MDMYFASTYDLNIVGYILDFHDTRELPRNIQKPVTDLLMSKYFAQSKSHNHLNLKE